MFCLDAYVSVCAHTFNSPILICVEYAVLGNNCGAECTEVAAATITPAIAVECGTQKGMAPPNGSVDLNGKHKTMGRSRTSKRAVQKSQESKIWQENKKKTSQEKRKTAKSRKSS